MPNVKTQQNKQTKKTLAYKASNIKIPSAFSETRQANTVRWNIENVERKKTSLARNLYPVKLHFKTEREIKGFSDQKKKKKQNKKKKKNKTKKKKTHNLMPADFALKEILKVFLREGK